MILNQENAAKVLAASSAATITTEELKGLVADAPSMSGQDDTEPPPAIRTQAPPAEPFVGADAERVLNDHGLAPGSVAAAIDALMPGAFVPLVNRDAEAPEEIAPVPDLPKDAPPLIEIVRAGVLEGVPNVGRIEIVDIYGRSTSFCVDSKTAHLWSSDLLRLSAVLRAR